MIFRASQEQSSLCQQMPATISKSSQQSGSRLSQKAQVSSHRQNTAVVKTLRLESESDRQHMEDKKTRSHAVASPLAFQGDIGVMSFSTRDRAVWAVCVLSDLATLIQNRWDFGLNASITNDGCDRVRPR